MTDRRFQTVPCTHDLLKQIHVQASQSEEVEADVLDRYDENVLRQWSRALIRGDEVLAAFGVWPLDPEHVLGAGWVLISESGIRDHWKSISRRVKRELDAVCDEFDRILTVVDTDVPKAANWAEWLGFLELPQPLVSDSAKESQRLFARDRVWHG